MTRARRLLAVALAAFALRAGLALVTERHPIFPAYYYTDARLTDEYAWDVAEAWRAGRPPRLLGSAAQTSQSLPLAVLYRLFGRRPLLGKLANAAVASAALALLYWLFVGAFGERRALGAALLVALWPSHAFFTSQNFKEALVMALTYGALACLLRAPDLGGAAAAACVASGFLCLLLLGFLRTYMAALLAFSLAAALAWALARERGPRRVVLAAALAAAAAAPFAFRPLSRLVFSGALALSDSAQATALEVVPVATASGRAGDHVVRPLSPRGIAEFRRIHQSHDRQWAQGQLGREIGTQLFVGVKLDTWLDVALFLPKGVFYALFMPLPLLYPMAGKLGRMLGAAENTVLLGLALLAAAALRRRPRALAAAGALLFFAVMASGSGLLEFDLGSATRHRIIYMPLLFPLALGWLSRENL